MVIMYLRKGLLAHLALLGVVSGESDTQNRRVQSGSHIGRETNLMHDIENLDVFGTSHQHENTKTRKTMDKAEAEIEVWERMLSESSMSHPTPTSSKPPSRAPSDTPSKSPSASPSELFTVLAYDNFEAGLGNWALGGDDAMLVAVTQSNSALLIRDGSVASSASASLSGTYDVTAYSQLRVDFAYSASGLEDGESFVLEYSPDGGATWVAVGTWVAGEEFVNGSVNQATVNIDTTMVNFTSTTTIRVRSSANEDDDQIFIDEIYFSGK